MRIHPRTRIVQQAGLDLTGAMLKIIREHKLTDAEIQIVLNEEARSWLKYALRHERHPDDPEKRGDEE